MPAIPPPPPANALAAGVAVVPAASTIYDAWAERALTAFRTSCPALVRRQDQSGLAQPQDWAPLCAQASNVAPEQAAAFFRDSFDWVRVGNGKAFATGYYEPEIQGSRTPQPGYAPIYAVPPDLVRCTRPDGTTGRGRVDQTGTCVPYFSRAEIDDGALANKDLEIAWAADPVDLFFVEIQGSGRIVFPDGTSMRIGYGDQNGLRLYGHRQAVAGPRHPSAGRRKHAVHQGWIRRQSRPGTGADARECFLHLLQAAERARVPSAH